MITNKCSSLLATLLDIAAHELLGIHLEHLVDFVQEVVEFRLQLLARVGGRGRGLFDGLFLAGRALLLLLLTFCHVGLLPPWRPNAPTPRSGSNIPPTTYRPS